MIRPFEDDPLIDHLALVVNLDDRDVALVCRERRFLYKGKKPLVAIQAKRIRPIGRARRTARNGTREIRHERRAGRPFDFDEPLPVEQGLPPEFDHQRFTAHSLYPCDRSRAGSACHPIPEKSR